MLIDLAYLELSSNRCIFARFQRATTLHLFCVFQLKQLLLNPNHDYRKEVDSVSNRIEHIDKVNETEILLH